MESWEFLLQKRGDKSWLPLEVPTVEILEGQYRLAAKSNFIETLIGIQIRYSPSADVGYQPLQQKLSKRTNPEGLLIVTPYTHLTPGTWQIFCFAIEPGSTATAPKNQKPWSTSIRFDVLPISPELAIELQLNHPDWSSNPGTVTGQDADAIKALESKGYQGAQRQSHHTPTSVSESTMSNPGDRLMRFKGEPATTSQVNQAQNLDQLEESLGFVSAQDTVTELDLDADLDRDLGADLDRRDQVTDHEPHEQYHDQYDQHTDPGIGATQDLTTAPASSGKL
jgi:hypothetical protein